MEWVDETCELADGDGIHIDGKCLRRAVTKLGKQPCRASREASSISAFSNQHPAKLAARAAAQSIIASETGKAGAKTTFATAWKGFEQTLAWIDYGDTMANYAGKLYEDEIGTWQKVKSLCTDTAVKANAVRTAEIALNEVHVEIVKPWAGLHLRPREGSRTHRRREALRVVRLVQLWTLLHLFAEQGPSPRTRREQVHLVRLDFDRRGVHLLADETAREVNDLRERILKGESVAAIAQDANTGNGEPAA